MSPSGNWDQSNNFNGGYQASSVEVVGLVPVAGRGHGLATTVAPGITCLGVALTPVGLLAYDTSGICSQN
jgi:hypothetical protein